MEPVLVLNEILINLPKREELSFFKVRAFPKLSRRGLEDRTRSSNDDDDTPFFVLPLVVVVVVVVEAVVVTVVTSPPPLEDDDDDAVLSFSLVTRAKYCIIFFVASVFPAPLSPLMMIL